MTTALIIGNGQIGAEIAAQLSQAGTTVRIATRSGGVPAAPRSHSTQTEAGAAATATVAAPTHIKADASDREQLIEAARGVDVIFACAHAAYDSRVWERVLPGLDAAVLDTAAELGIPVVFPESVYAFAGLDQPITEDSPFAPVDDKGRIRQRLLEARTAHPATSASVIAGDLLGRTAEPKTSVVRLCITEPIAHGRRAFVPARADVAHGITVIADLAAAMIRAAELLAGVPAGTHKLLLAPASNPTLAEIAEFTHSELGSRAKHPLALPHWVIRAIGLFDRSMYEVGQLGPIWYEPCVIEPGTLGDSVPTTDWRDGVRQML
ncbi:NAD-dependent epimerase/dehydratase family protein [Brevibacterium atlanticum]|uniref:NAD-dependent epimerase/dehydratase family protein n=1 Tax=Brevibacterium atlanticum TaxID=2697563 RepID=UPI00141D7A8F|nr:NAD-dependent epimerase/dehydratase family protein [Brevibacterium atlanticum]